MEGMEEPEGMEGAGEQALNQLSVVQVSSETEAASMRPARVCTWSFCIYYSFHSPECENKWVSDSCACS